MPARPKLTTARDTNSWNAYYQYGIEIITKRPGEAADAFYWATRLDPSQAEPYYARGLAVLARSPLVLLQFFYETQAVASLEDVQTADSLMYEGLRRNPFMQATLDNRVIEEAFQRVTEQPLWLRAGNTPGSQAYAAYLKGQMGRAAALYADAIKRDGSQLGYRVMRARALAIGGSIDTAMTELTRVIEEMRKRDQKRLVSRYQSKAEFEYELAMVADAGGKDELARAAYGRALTEDLTLYLAHYRLGQLLFDLGDTTTALTEYSQAAELRPNDGYMRAEYGAALARAKRFAEAEPQFKRAIALEPFFAPSYFNLAFALEQQGKKRDSAELYRAFVLRAPQSMGKEIQTATMRASENAKP